MSRPASEWGEIPEATRQIAKGAFRKPTAIMVLRDKIGPIYRGEDFKDFYPRVGQHGLRPELLALVTVLQFMEGLSDREVADAVRGRIDVKYALGLELNDPGFDASVLTEFRGRLVAGDSTSLLLDRLLAVCQELGLVKAGGAQRTDSTHVVGAVQELNRLGLVLAAVGSLLNRLAVIAPDWVKARVPAAWGKRYGAHVSEFRLPKAEAKRQALALQVGKDGYQLMEWLHADWVTTPFHARPIWEIWEAEAVRLIWLQQYYRENDHIALRTMDNMPPVGHLVASPHDIEVRYSRKRTTNWVGYVVHFSETCADDLPHLVTDVLVTPSAQRDQSALGTIQENLIAHGLAPDVQYADSGYLSAANLVAAKRRKIELVGPAQADTHWQAQREEAYALPDFHIDWQQQVATCPQGKRSSVWSHSARNDQVAIRIRFSRNDCAACPARTRCTTAAAAGRSLQVHAQLQQAELQAARNQSQAPAFQKRYACRAGIEGTIAQAVHDGAASPLHRPHQN